MKKLFFFAFTALLLRGMVPGVAAFPEEKNPDDRIQVACSPDLKTLVKECIDSYKENGGQSAIEFVYIDPSQAGEWLLEPGHIGLFSKNGMSELEPQNFDVFVIGRAVYVPVMNPANPLKDTILLHGISPREFSLLYSIEGETTWGALIGTGDHLPAIGAVTEHGCS